MEVCSHRFEPVSAASVVQLLLIAVSSMDSRLLPILFAKNPSFLDFLLVQWYEE